MAAAAAGLALAWGTAGAVSAPAGEEPTRADDLVLEAGAATVDAQFDTGCLPDPASGLTECVDGEAGPVRAVLRTAARRRVLARLALPARSVTVVLERNRGGERRLTARATSDARTAYAFRLPSRVRSGDVLRLTARYDPRGNATFLTRLRIAAPARCGGSCAR